MLQEVFCYTSIHPNPTIPKILDLAHEMANSNIFRHQHPRNIINKPQSESNNVIGGH